MTLSKLHHFASAGVYQREGSAVLIDKALEKAGHKQDVHLPAVSTSTGAAVTAVIRLG